MHIQALVLKGYFEISMSQEESLSVLNSNYSLTWVLMKPLQIW